MSETIRSIVEAHVLGMDCIDIPALVEALERHIGAASSRTRATCHLCSHVGRVVDVDAYAAALEVDAADGTKTAAEILHDPLGHGESRGGIACWDGNACMERRHKLKDDA